VARPSKFTPERRERFLAAFSTGVFAETAARHAGWSPATFYRILGGTSPDHVAFREDVRHVETELELRLAGTVTQAAFRDPRLAMAMLERRFSERWGRRAELAAPLEQLVRPGAPPPPQRERTVFLPMEALTELTRKLLEDKRAEHAKRLGPAVEAEPVQVVRDTSPLRAAGLRVSD
jgi:hypothetical protein